MNKRTSYSEIFKKYVPIEFASMLADLLIGTNVKFKVVRGRKTKLGDFRYGSDLPKPIITVNGDLNPYAFLITALHEFAHYHTYINYKNRVQPHGEEWKTAYRTLLLPVIDSKHLPKDIETALMRSLTNTKASSCADIHLSRALDQYDLKDEEPLLCLEQISKNTTFVLNGKQFVKLNKRRTRYECQETTSGKIYLVHALAKVTIIEL